jgi:hypothetical protein
MSLINLLVGSWNMFASGEENKKIFQRILDLENTGERFVIHEADVNRLTGYQNKEVTHFLAKKPSVGLPPDGYSLGYVPRQIMFVRKTGERVVLFKSVTATTPLAKMYEGPGVTLEIEH